MPEDSTQALLHFRDPGSVQLKFRAPRSDLDTKYIQTGLTEGLRLRRMDPEANPEKHSAEACLRCSVHRRGRGVP